MKRQHKHNGNVKLPKCKQNTNDKQRCAWEFMLKSHSVKSQTGQWMSLGFSIVSCRLGTTTPAFWEKQANIDWKCLINGKSHAIVHCNAGCWVLNTWVPHYDHSLFSFYHWNLHQTDACRQYQVSHLLVSNAGQTWASCFSSLCLIPAESFCLADSSSSVARTFKELQYSLICRTFCISAAGPWLCYSAHCFCNLSTCYTIFKLSNEGVYKLVIANNWYKISCLGLVIHVSFQSWSKLPSNGVAMLNWYWCIYFTKRKHVHILSTWDLISIILKANVAQSPVWITFTWQIWLRGLQAPLSLVLKVFSDGSSKSLYRDQAENYLEASVFVFGSTPNITAKAFSVPFSVFFLFYLGGLSHHNSALCWLFLLFCEPFQRFPWRCDHQDLPSLQALFSVS